MESIIVPAQSTGTTFIPNKRRIQSMRMLWIIHLLFSKILFLHINKYCLISLIMNKYLSYIKKFNIIMKQIIHFVVSKSDSYYVADCVELPIVTQGKTLDETMYNIKEATSLHLEYENLDELMICSNPAISVNIDLAEIEYA